MMDRQPKDNSLSEKALQEFLDRGGKIQKFEYGQRSENIGYTNNFYGKRNKKQDEKADEE